MTSPLAAAWTDDFLWQKRRVGDPPADAVIQTLLDRNQKGEIDQIFQMLVRNRDFPNPAFDALPMDVKTVVEEYFVATRKLPTWAKPYKLMIAADVFRQYGPQILMILLCKSLPLCYTCWRGAKVLYRTGRLRVHDGSLDSFTRRLMETAQFVVNILQPNSFEHNGDAILSIQKVRLMHAAIRFHAQERGWDLETYGVPINQEDLVGTLLSFNVVIVDGLKQLDIELTPEESDAYFHLWRVVGHLIGVDDDLNSEDADECRMLMDAILKQQAGPSVEGTELTDACIDLMDSRLSFGPFREVAHVLVRFFIGDPYADMLQVRREDAEDDSFALNAMQWLDKRFRSVSERSVLVAALGRAFSSTMIEMVLDYHNGSKNEQFYLPSALTDTWQASKPEFRIPTVQRIDEVIFYLDNVLRHFRAQNNPIGLFTAVYRMVTQRVADGIRMGLFENNAKMEEVDVRFGNRYFEALNHYFDDEPASAPWQVSFDAARQMITTNQHIFAAANAHITYDLSLVVTDLFPGDEIHRFRNDYDRMNQLFDDMYDQMNDNIARIYRPFGLVVTYLDEQLKNAEKAYMKRGRTLAWQKSIELAKAITETERERLRAELETASAALGRKIIRPPWLLHLPLRYIARKEFGTTAHKVDVMLRSALMPTVS
ncbi:DUF5995 family protein [Larkinella sp. VNQ87]|uniref:DUF5995 family protein n=1 Tax=Larkinella sp. VNQ87 TaxID=3400921 RepID=UPI003C01941E